MQQGPGQQPPQIIVVQQPSSPLTEGCYGVLWGLLFVFLLAVASCAGCYVYGRTH